MPFKAGVNALPSQVEIFRGTELIESEIRKVWKLFDTEKSYLKISYKIQRLKEQ